MFKKLVLMCIVFSVMQGVYAKELYPKDVNDFVERRDQCDYFRGEVSGEPQIDNARDLNEELDKYCKGTDNQLKELQVKYKDNQSILTKLNAYEFIECVDNSDDD